MSEILSKSLWFAVDAVKDKITVPLVEENLFYDTVLKSDCVYNEVVPNQLDDIRRDFDKMTSDQKHKALKLVIFCSQMTEIWQISYSFSSFGPIVVTFLETATTLPSKRLAYLCLLSLLQRCNTEVAYLSVNSIIKDISGRVSEVIVMALNAAGNIKDVDLLPVILPAVEKRLTYPDVKVRCQVFRTLHFLLKNCPLQSFDDYERHMRLALSDKSPHVMATSLPYLDVILEVSYFLSFFSP